MSKLDEATELVERAAGAAGKLAEQVAGAAGTVAKVAKEVGIGHGKMRKNDQAPPAKARAGKQPETSPATVPARQYAWRALTYALLFTLGAVFLLLYIIKAEGNVTYILPAVVGVSFFLFLAGGFRLAYASLRLRAPKEAPSRAAVTRVAEDIPLRAPANGELSLALAPTNVDSVVPRVSNKTVRALVKLLRLYGGGLRGMLDTDLERFARAELEDPPIVEVSSENSALYTPVLQTLSHVLQLRALKIQTSSIINLVRLYTNNSDKTAEPIVVNMEKLFLAIPTLQNFFHWPHFFSAIIRGQGIQRSDVRTFIPKHTGTTPAEGTPAEPAEGTPAEPAEGTPAEPAEAGTKRINDQINVTTEVYHVDTIFRAT